MWHFQLSLLQLSPLNSCWFNILGQVSFEFILECAQASDIQSLGIHLYSWIGLTFRGYSSICFTIRLLNIHSMVHLIFSHRWEGRVETSLKQHWNFLETPLKLHWNSLETFCKHPQNFLEIFLKLPWNTLQTSNTL